MQPLSIPVTAPDGIEGGHGASASPVVSHKQLYLEARRQRRECERENKRLRRRGAGIQEIEVVTLSDTDDEEEGSVECPSPFANPIRRDANMNVLITSEDSGAYQSDGEVYGSTKSQSRDPSPSLVQSSAVEQSEEADDQSRPVDDVIALSDGEENTARRDEEKTEQESEEKLQGEKEKEHNRDYVRRRIDAVVRRLSNRDATCQIASCATCTRVSSHSDLRRHAIAHYQGPKRYQCRHCKHAANDRRSVVQHSRTRHPAQKAAVRDTADEQMWFAIDCLALRCFDGATGKEKTRVKQETKTVTVSVSSGGVQKTYNFPATNRVDVLRKGDCARHFGLTEGFRVYHVHGDSLRRVSDDTQFQSLAVDGALSLELLRPAGQTVKTGNPAPSEEDPMFVKERDVSCSGGGRRRLDRKRKIACQKFRSCPSSVHHSNTARHAYTHLKAMMYGCTRCEFKANMCEPAPSLSTLHHTYAYHEFAFNPSQCNNYCLAVAKSRWIENMKNGNYEGPSVGLMTEKSWCLCCYNKCAKVWMRRGIKL